MTNPYRIRFGVKHPFGVLPNALVAVFYASASDYQRLQGAVGVVKDVLMLAGQKGLADRFVLEGELKK